MAMFHFRLKLDKTLNGTKILAIKHVEYIDREGSFAHDEQWKENNKFVGDFITTAETSKRARQTKCAPLQDRRIRRNKEHRARIGSDGKSVIDNNIDCADVSG